jgi:hypothetical protein
VILEPETVSWSTSDIERFEPLRLSAVDHLPPGHEAADRQV